MTTIIINNYAIMIDPKTEKYFGFKQDQPAICAQGDSIKEVINKIDKIYNTINGKQD